MLFYANFQFQEHGKSLLDSDKGSRVAVEPLEFCFVRNF